LSNRIIVLRLSFGLTQKKQKVKAGFLFAAPKARKTANKINSLVLSFSGFSCIVHLIFFFKTPSLRFKHYFVFAGFSVLSPLKEIRP
jgi:hypothetical protein